MGSAHRPAFPSPGTAAPEDLMMAPTQESARPGHILTPPFANCGLWTRHIMYWGAGSSSGRWVHSALPQRGGEQGQDVGTLVKNAGLPPPPHAHTHIHTPSAICEGLNLNPGPLVALL